MHQLMEVGAFSASETLLAVCAGEAERDLFLSLGLKTVTLTSLDPIITSGRMAPFQAEIADVRRLPFPDASFDHVFVSDGLHHCDSPHTALVEMYRVARKSVIVFESRDSWTMRLAVVFGLTEEYELSAVSANNGTCAGVNYTAVPNFIFRWTEREFEKTISCTDPTGRPAFRYFYGFNPPARSHSGLRRVIYSVMMVFAKAGAWLLKKQRNSFCMVAFRPTELFPWLEREQNSPQKLRFRDRHG